MKIIVTGAKGQLGKDITAALSKKGHFVIPTDVDSLNIISADAVAAFIGITAPDVIVHCAAYTAVDKAESEKELCTLINETGTSYIASAAERSKSKMIYISTDYVYGSNGTMPLPVTADINPLNHYGLTKYNGELAAKQCSRLFTVRTSWVFGHEGANFVKTMLRLGKERDSLSVVADQVGSPTFTEDLAALICDMAESDKYGTYNATNEGFCSWYEFAVEIFALAGLNVSVSPVTTEEYGAPALRQKNSRLCKKCLDDAGFNRLPSWQDALSRYIKNER